MIKIRKAKGSDAQAILDLRKRAILKACVDHYSSMQLSIWTASKLTEGLIHDVEDSWYVSESNSQIIGSGKLTIETSMIDGIFVDPEFMGQGAAKLMMDYLECLAQNNGLSTVKLDSTLNAAPFYKKCGYVGDRLSTYHSPGGVSLDCIPMHKMLSQSHINGN